jgi:hypothetical protein
LYLLAALSSPNGVPKQFAVNIKPRAILGGPLSIGGKSLASVWLPTVSTITTSDSLPLLVMLLLLLLLPLGI